MEDIIKKLIASQFTGTFICHLINLADCVKQAPKTFETGHFRVHSLAHGIFSSPRANKRIETFYQFNKNLMTLNANFYGWLVKVISSKSINFFCYHIF